MVFHASTKRAVPDSVWRPAHRLARAVAEAAAHPSFALSRAPVAGDLIAAVVPPKRPSILLVSLPRAGSSWIGGILGAAEGALYLREPLTQSTLEHVGRKGTAAYFELGACKDKRAYERFAALTFKGIPRFNRGIVQYPEQWRLATRSGKQIVVKEVNPLVIEYLWERYRPRIVFLVRHPVPMMRSFAVLGSSGERFRAAFLPETLAAIEKDYVIPEGTDLYEQGGAFQAIIQHRVMSFLKSVDHMVVRYEDVCADPLAEFTRIFDFCGLPLSAALRQEIVRSSQAENDYVPGAYDTARNSVAMKDRWKHEMDPRDIERVRRSYFANRPIFYTDESDW